MRGHTSRLLTRGAASGEAGREAASPLRPGSLRPGSLATATCFLMSAPADKAARPRRTRAVTRYDPMWPTVSQHAATQRPWPWWRSPAAAPACRRPRTGCSPRWTPQCAAPGCRAWAGPWRCPTRCGWGSVCEPICAPIYASICTCGWPLKAAVWRHAGTLPRDRSSPQLPPPRHPQPPLPLDSLLPPLLSAPSSVCACSADVVAVISASATVLVPSLRSHLFFPAAGGLHSRPTRGTGGRLPVGGAVGRPPS